MDSAQRLIGALVGCAALIATCAGAGGQNAALPRTFQFGKSADVLRPLLAQDCEQTEEMHYTGKIAAPFSDQTQINCLGLEVFGARRRVEFMFDDGALGHLWIQIRREEVTELRGNLEKTFGPVVYKTKIYDVFASGTVALRLQPVEVLVATPDLIAKLTGYQRDSR